MSELFIETVKSNVCQRDLHSECAYEGADAATCVKCTADAFGEIVRKQL
jgi:hypothetical protein